ncbi:Uncharacterised protein [Mycobacteroides abscessus subsp. abscessus]|nr:Uncharacterised protein [Mycobacteroides abscessus subsp. abscessus]
MVGCRGAGADRTRARAAGRGCRGRSRRGRRHRRGAQSDISRARRDVEPVGAPADRQWGRSRTRRGRRDGPVRRTGGGVVGRAQGRRRVRAGGPHPPRRTYCHGAGFGRRHVRADTGRGPDGRRRRPSGVAGGRGSVRLPSRTDHRRRAPGAIGGRQHRLCHFHVGLDGRAQGRGGQPRRPAGCRCSTT